MNYNLIHKVLLKTIDEGIYPTQCPKILTFAVLEQHCRNHQWHREVGDENKQGEEGVRLMSQEM